MRICVLILVFFSASVFCDGDAKPEQVGQGEWNLVIKTESFTGDGCDELGIEQEIRTGLVIAPFEDQVCTPESPECAYVFKWKCAEFNPEEDHPKSQDVHVGANFADLSARISVPPSVYNSYGGRMAIESENYLVSDQSLRGNQTWIWTNKDNTKQCRGVDHIIGLLGSYDCSGVHDVIDEALDPDAPAVPPPEGRWRLKASTVAASGDGCDAMGIKVGFTINSAVIITKSDEFAGPDAAPTFDVFWKCSTDESLVEWQDYSGTVTQLAGGNVSLVINRTLGEKKSEDDGKAADGGGGNGRRSGAAGKGRGGGRRDAAEGGGGGEAAAGKGEGGGEEVLEDDDGYEETRSSMILIFCPVHGPDNTRDYKICRGREYWTWRYGDGRECKGVDKIRGSRGDCTDKMETALEVAGLGLGDADDDEWLGDDDYGFDPMDQLTDAELAGEELPPDAFNTWDEGPKTKEGYQILDYHAPKSSTMGLLLVGVPVGTLLVGLTVAYYRRRIAARAAAAYALVGTGTGSPDQA